MTGGGKGMWWGVRIWGHPHGGGRRSPRLRGGRAVGFALRGSWGGPCGGGIPVGGGWVALHGRGPSVGPLRPLWVGSAVLRAPRFPGGGTALGAEPSFLPHFQEQRNPARRSVSLWLSPEVPTSPRANAEEQKSHRPPPTVTPPRCPAAGRAVGRLSPLSPVHFAQLTASSKASGSDASPRTALPGVGMGGEARGGTSCCTWGPRGDSRPPPNPLQLCNGGTSGLERSNVDPSPPPVPPLTQQCRPGVPRTPPNILTVPLQVPPRRAAPACSSVSLRSSVETRRSYRHNSTSSGPPRVPAARSPYP